MAQKDGGPARCKWCDGKAARKQGRIWLCAKHYRFQQMRVRAKRDGKSVPSYQELEGMAMRCPGCGVPMHWLISDGQRSGQATLQHDRSGLMRLLCLGCNVRHAAHPGDEFYHVPHEHKRCGACGDVKPFAAFVTDRSRPIGLKSSCRECSRVQHLEWVSRNREHVNAKQREGRARRAANG